jgi:hypothetical protein
MMTTKNLHDNAERPQCWTYEGEIIRAQLITWWLEEKFLFDKFRQSKVYCYSSQQNSQNTRDLKLQQWLGDRSIKFLIIFSVESHYCFRSCRLIWVFMEINISSTTVLFSFRTSVSLFVRSYLWFWIFKYKICPILCKFEYSVCFAVSLFEHLYFLKIIFLTFFWSVTRAKNDSYD